MKNKFTALGKNHLENIVNQSKTLSEVLYNFKYTRSKAAYEVLKRSLDYFEIDYSNKYKSFYKEKNIKNSTAKKPTEHYLIENSKVNNYFLKKRLIDENIIKNECQICKIEPFWNGQSLSLQLDHINGINNDNRLENLRLLCPNCHSQTYTFSAKNRKIEKKRNYCIECKKEIYLDSTRCETCNKVFKKENAIEDYKIDPADLQELLWKMSMVKIAEIYGCSDRTIKDKAIKYNLSIPPKGYFIRKENV